MFLFNRVSVQFTSFAENKFSVSILTKYTASLYWATATLTFTGYGDVRPSTLFEKFFSVVVMLSSQFLQCIYF